MNTQHKTLLVSFSCALTLTACGGGGGNTPAPVASDASFNLQSAQRSEFVTPSVRNFSVSGTSNGFAVTGSGTETAGSVTAGTFEGTAALQRTITVSGSVVVNGITLPLAASTTDWTDTNYVPRGSASTSEYTVIQGTPAIPTAARVGDLGTLFTATRYADSTRTGLIGTMRTTYSLAADTATTALVSVTSLYYSASGAHTRTVSRQYRINTSNQLTPVLVSDVDFTSNLNLLLQY